MQSGPAAKGLWSILRAVSTALSRANRKLVVASISL